MSRHFGLLLIVLVLCVCALGFSDTYYVAINGNDSNPGTEKEPFQAIEKAMEIVRPGETIFVRGGAYTPSSTITLREHGSEGNCINLWAYPGETPILDFSRDSDSSNGLEIDGNFWHLKGLVVTKAGNKGINVNGANNIIENTVTHSNVDGGIKLDTGAARNLILNCDSYLNYDRETQGENADGFAAKHELGEGNIFKRCRAWNNSDDGFDFMEAGSAVRVEGCYSFSNGQNVWQDPDFTEDEGNGFKLGQEGGAHVVIRCAAWGNADEGFNVHENTSGVTLYNNTAWNNNKNFFFDSHLSLHKLRNNVSFRGKVVMWDGIDHENNSWNGGFSVAQDDFLSLDDAAMKGPRNPDGSLSEGDFLKLAPGSDLIDGGIDIGLPFNGKAPDLGAFEMAPKGSFD